MTQFYVLFLNACVICSKVNSSKHGNTNTLVVSDKCDVTER